MAIIKSKVMVLEPDRLLAKFIKQELSSRDFDVMLVTNADSAISAADEFLPDLVVSELSLAGHSGSEFLYEYRTYSDFIEIPVVIFSSMKVTENIKNTKDWQLLDISEILYKPDDSLKTLADVVESILSN